MPWTAWTGLPRTSVRTSTESNATVHPHSGQEIAAKTCPVKALKDIRVVDFTKVLAGPLCTQYLGDLGADVIKVEPLEHGDDTRRWPPFRQDEGVIFLSTNRSKRSIALNLKSSEGARIRDRLIASADIVLESFGPGVAERLGLNFKSIQQSNPRAICCSFSGYGSSGPMRKGKGFDLILQAFSGMLSMTGEPGGSPSRSPFSPVDQTTGLHALAGILAALIQRQKTGKGQHIEASLFDTATALLAYPLQGYWLHGKEPEKPGSSHESLCPYQAFETADRPIILGIANDALWRAFCRVAGIEKLTDDPRFQTNANRVENRQETVSIVRGLLLEKGRDAWLETLNAAGIPCSPVHSLGEASAHPHTGQSGMVFEYTDTNTGSEPLKGVAYPLKFDGRRPAVERRPPRLGEHSREVLEELGFGPEEHDGFETSGVIHQPIGEHGS